VVYLHKSAYQKLKGIILIREIRHIAFLVSYCKIIFGTKQSVKKIFFPCTIMVTLY
jgi:hypothetical protein